jgi:hypothetical protein
MCTVCSKLPRKTVDEEKRGSAPSKGKCYEMGSLALIGVVNASADIIPGMVAWMVSIASGENPGLRWLDRQSRLGKASQEFSTFQSLLQAR